MGAGRSGDAGPSGGRYIGSEDPEEAERQAVHAAGVLDELRSALALHPPLPRARVLELGCGAGNVTQALLELLVVMMICMCIVT